MKPVQQFALNAPINVLHVQQTMIVQYVKNQELIHQNVIVQLINMMKKVYVKNVATDVKLVIQVHKIVLDQMNVLKTVFHHLPAPALKDFMMMVLLQNVKNVRASVILVMNQEYAKYVKEIESPHQDVIVQMDGMNLALYHQAMPHAHIVIAKMMVHAQNVIICVKLAIML